MKSSRSWDAIILGGGIIGVSLARELHKHGADVLIIERGEPGREASHAAAGMLAPQGLDLQPELEDLAIASAALYPEFVREVEDESGIRVDLRRTGSILSPSTEEKSKLPAGMKALDYSSLAEMEPHLASDSEAYLIKDATVDPRALLAALIAAAKHREIDFVSGSQVTGVSAETKTLKVATTKSHYQATAVVNCCGAWAGEIRVSASQPVRIPTQPIKGQMLSVVAPRKNFLKHALCYPDVYLVPRSDGRILIGATVEEAGFDKRVVPSAIQRMHQSAANLLPELGEARLLEAWAGLRPCTPDHLPILDATSIPGYFVATGHFRNGILLAPVTARVMAQLVRGVQPEFDIARFSAARFNDGL